MKERPILFSGAMVRAILEGRKTQTRRVVKGLEVRHSMPEPELASLLHCCPYGVPSDQLWVRETWQYADWTEDGEPWIRYQAGGLKSLRQSIPEEWADRLTDTWAALSVPENYRLDNYAVDRRWRPSIHMPRWASRITLEVTGVRVERLQDISEADALDEGVEWSAAGDGWRRYADAPSELAGLPPCPTARDSYRSLWEQINGPDSWAANPWVWCIDFRVTP